MSFSSAPVLLMAPSGRSVPKPCPSPRPTAVASIPIRFPPKAGAWQSIFLLLPPDMPVGRMSPPSRSLASPQFHPDLGASDASVTISGQGSASALHACYFAGRYAALGDGWRPRSRSNVIAAVGRFESQCCRIAFFVLLRRDVIHFGEPHPDIPTAAAD